MVRTFKEGQRLVLERNQYYLRGERDDADEYVRPKTLIVDLSLTPSEQLAQYEAGKIFFMGYLPVESRASYVNNEDLVTKDTLTTHTYYFNTTKAPFNNPTVRQALSMAIDRAAIAEKLVFASAAKGFIPDAAWNTTRKNSFRENGKNLIASSADLAQAQGLISAANLPADQKTIKIAVRPNEVDILVAETVKAAWEQLGFTVEVKLNTAAGSITATVVEPDAAAGCVCVDVAAQHFIHLIHKSIIANGFCTAQDFLG
jgi:ABC-type transport system substrate-binding protein